MADSFRHVVLAFIAMCARTKDAHAGLTAARLPVADARLGHIPLF